MSLFLWIVAIYFSVALGSYPFIKYAVKARPQPDSEFSDEFVARTISYIPLINLLVAYFGIKDWIRMLLIRRATNKLKKIMDKSLVESKIQPSEGYTKAWEELNQYLKQTTTIDHE